MDPLEVFGHFCGCDTVHVLPVSRHGYGVSLFLPSSIIVTEWSCLMVIFGEIVYVSRGPLWSGCECQISSCMSATPLFLIMLIT